MITKWLAVFIFYKNINSFSSYAETWDGIAPKSITENTKTMRQKPSRSYMSNPLFTSKEMTESIFPDVIYPTSILDVREPYYFAATGFDDLLKPFSDDVKSSYKALNSDIEKKTHLAKHKAHSIQNMKNGNKNLNHPILQEHNINKINIFNITDEAIEQNNETNLDIVALDYDLFNEINDIECNNISHNLFNDTNNTILQENKLAFEIATSIIHYAQDNTTNEKNLNAEIISNNLEEYVFPRGLNKTEVKSEANITVLREDYDTMVDSDNMETYVILKVFNETEVENDANITRISENYNLTSNDAICIKWTKCENEKLAEEFNHLIDHDVSKITELELLRKLLNTKTVFDSILYILHNFNDTNHVFLNTSLMTIDKIIEDGRLKDYYDSVVSNTFLEENDTEAESSTVYKLYEIYDSYVDNFEKETMVEDVPSLEIIPGTLDDIMNSLENSCTLKGDERNDSNENHSIDDVAFDIIEIICDYPEELYSKSSASSIISTFDGFKSNKNPFLVLFHHFPLSTISDP